jgi:hypothetical protein
LEGIGKNLTVWRSKYFGVLIGEMTRMRWRRWLKIFRRLTDRVEIFRRTRRGFEIFRGKRVLPAKNPIRAIRRRALFVATTFLFSRHGFLGVLAAFALGIALGLYLWSLDLQHLLLSRSPQTPSDVMTNISVIDGDTVHSGAIPIVWLASTRRSVATSPAATARGR